MAGLRGFNNVPGNFLPLVTLFLSFGLIFSFLKWLSHHYAAKRQSYEQPRTLSVCGSGSGSGSGGLFGGVQRKGLWLGAHLQAHPCSQRVGPFARAGHHAHFWGSVWWLQLFQANPKKHKNEPFPVEFWTGSISRPLTQFSEWILAQWVQPWVSAIPENTGCGHGRPSGHRDS